jgi:hypothetical protein
MRAILAAFLLALIGAPLPAQTPAQTPAPASGAPASGAPATRTYSDPLGFSYVLPGDWEVFDAQPSSPPVQQQAAPNLAGEGEKKGMACLQVGLTTRHGDPGSVIVQVALPFDCFGRKLTDGDIPGFGAGVTEGIKQNFESSDSQVARYMLGSHSLWVERVHGAPKGLPDKHFTVEISCALLSKAAVCWMAITADSASLTVFEHGAVTLEGDSPEPLVPAGTFKP